MAAELPGTTWLLWTAQNFPRVGERRIEQLIAIGEGRTTQDEINADQREWRVSDEAMRAAEEILRRSDGAAHAYAAPRTARDDRRNEGKRHRRAEARTVREANGARMRAPLVPIEHRRLLKEACHLLGFMSFDDLKLAVDAIKGILWAGTAEVEVEVEAAQFVEQPEVAEPSPAAVEPLPEAVAVDPEPVVDQPEPVAESEPSAIAKKMARAESEPVGEALADGGNLSQRDLLVDAFLAKGGTVTKCPPSRRKAA